MDKEPEISAAVETAAHKAAPLFNLFGWTYLSQKTPPTIHQLEQDIDGQFRRMYGSDSEISQQGRIVMLRSKDEEGKYDYHICLDLAHIFGLDK